MPEEQQPSPRYVSLNGRILATFIDLFLSSLLLLPFIESEYPPVVQEAMNKMHQGVITQEAAIVEMGQYFLHGGGAEIMAFNSTLQFILAGFIVILFWTYRSATPGKILLKMRIVDIKTGKKPSTIQWIVRYIGYLLSSLPFLLGFLWVGIDRRGQGWHDKLAGTAVIYVDERPSRNFVIIMLVIAVLGFLSIGKL